MSTATAAALESDAAEDWLTSSAAKPALLVGAGGFAITSAIGGIAPSFAVLVTARALQGIFAALLAPAILSLLNTTFTEPKERAKAFGIYGAIGASGMVLGLLVGGTLTQFLD